MKENRRLNKLLFILALPVLMLACEDEGSPAGTGSDFATLTSGYFEEDGTAAITIPFRNASASFAANVELTFGGTATEGEDYTVVGVTEEGIQISIIDDGEFEYRETIRILMDSKGNNIHTVTLVSNCDDIDAFDNSIYDYFAADFNATEIYAPDDMYGPYVLELEEDEDVPNKYWMHNFWDSGLNAYIVYDPLTNMVSFPQQVPVAGFPTRIITSDPTTVSDGCSFTITTYYRGNVWDYEFVRSNPL